MGNEVVGSISEWSGMLKDMFRKIDDGSISLKMMREFACQGKNNSLFHTDEDGQKELWEKFSDKFGLNLDLSGEIPEAPLDFGWVQPPVKGHGPQEFFNLCGEIMPKVGKFTDESLDSVIVAGDDRSPLEPPTDRWIRMRASWEADEIWKNHSHNQLIENHADKQFLCLPRILLQSAFVYWVESHPLDRKTITLTGSRYSDGHIPGVGWYDGELWVLWYHSGNRHDHLRVRQAVS